MRITRSAHPSKIYGGSGVDPEFCLGALVLTLFFGKNVVMSLVMTISKC